MGIAQLSVQLALDLRRRGIPAEHTSFLLCSWDVLYVIRAGLVLVEAVLNVKQHSGVGFGSVLGFDDVVAGRPSPQSLGPGDFHLSTFGVLIIGLKAKDVVDLGSRHGKEVEENGLGEM